jgi:hypothetical protein
MPPDTTQTVFDWLTHFKDRFDLLSTLLGILGGGGLVGLIGFLVKALAWLKQWRDRRSLRRRLGATLYTPEDIERATRHYIRPHCQSIDPAQGPEISGVYASREDLFAATDRLLHQPAESKYLLLLADSGMGKTSFLLNCISIRSLIASKRGFVRSVAFRRKALEIKKIFEYLKKHFQYQHPTPKGVTTNDYYEHYFFRLLNTSAVQ